jgi:hypothetical protein
MIFIPNKLKALTLISCLTLISTGCAQTKTLNTQLTYIEPYCGGARPTPEMEKDAQTPRPYANRKVYVVSEKRKVDTLTTDDKGNITFKLKKGKYKVYEAWRFLKQTPDQSPSNRFIPDCLKEEWKKEFMQVTVTKKSISQTTKYDLINHCDYKLPCFLEGFKPPMRE